MAIRYSGDVEVRLGYDPRRRAYVGSVRDPGGPNGPFRWRGVYEGSSPKNSADYDRAAKEMIIAADRDCRRESDRHLMVERDGGAIRIRRVFQAPCPIRGYRRSGKLRW